MKPRGGLAQYRAAAREHLEWCDKVGIKVLGGRWDLEDPISGLLLSAVVAPESATALICALCGKNWKSVDVHDVWWPSAYVDMIVNFQVAGRHHSLVLEHKHLNSPSNAPGYRRVGGGVYWQTESMLRELDRARSQGEETLLGGPFDSTAQAHLVVLDARGRQMDQIFELDASDVPHRHFAWRVVSYEELASSLRSAYRSEAPIVPLKPLLGQLFASERHLGNLG